MRGLALVALIAAIELVYVFLISAGHFDHWPTRSNIYELLADGFRSGHLHLSVEPSPQLIAQKNPFDPVNAHLWFWDISYSAGHYYLYWGPVPALIIAAVKTILRLDGPKIGDQYPGFLFYSMYLIAGATLIILAARRLFPRTPFWLVALSIAVFGFANPTPFLIVTPSIYIAAIAGAQAFLVLGLLLAFCAIAGSEASTLKRRLLLLGAGTCWGLAFGCRGSVALPTALLVATVALAASPPRGGGRAWAATVRTAALTGAPFAAAVLAFLVYNRLRFQSWFDFGLSKQLTDTPFRTNPSFLWPNLYAYLLRPLQVSCRFPFLGVLPQQRGYPQWLALPPGYSRPDPIAGIVATMPWIWFALVGVVLIGRDVAHAWHQRGELLAVDRTRRARLWCAVAFLAVGTTTGLPTITEFFASMRFVADVSGGLVLLGIWGAWSLYEQACGRAWTRRLTVSSILVLASASIVTGFLLGMGGGYDHMFQRNNPALLTHLTSALSFCRS